MIFPRDKAPALYDRILALLAGRQGGPVIGQEAIQMPTIVSLMAAGLGIALVPEREPPGPGCAQPAPRGGQGNLGRPGVSL